MIINKIFIIDKKLNGKLNKNTIKILIYILINEKRVLFFHDITINKSVLKNKYNMKIKYN